MTVYVALLRALNVGGRFLKMDDLKRIAHELDLGSPQTYIATGNLLFTSFKSETALRALLEKQLEEHLGTATEVMIRTATEMAQASARNPFRSEPANHVIAFFLNDPPPVDVAEQAKNRADEKFAVGAREIYIYYPKGVSQSKLKLPAATVGTGRNMNTVEKLAQLAKDKA